MADNLWVVLITASKWYSDMLDNWLFWYRKLSLDMNVVLIAEDIYIFEKYKNVADLTVHLFNANQVFGLIIYLVLLQ